MNIYFETDPFLIFITQVSKTITRQGSLNIISYLILSYFTITEYYTVLKFEVFESLNPDPSRCRTLPHQPPLHLRRQVRLDRWSVWSILAGRRYTQIWKHASDIYTTFSISAVVSFNPIPTIQHSFFLYLISSSKYKSSRHKQEPKTERKKNQK